MIGYVWHQDAKEQVMEILAPYNGLHEYIYVDPERINLMGRLARKHVDGYLEATGRDDHRKAELFFGMMVEYLTDVNAEPPDRLAYASAVRIHLSTATTS